jgi:elongation factor G
MGELHLDILVDRMRREFKVEANVGKPQVAYRETIRKQGREVDYTHKKQTGGSGQFAGPDHRLEPLDTGEGEVYEFENKVTGGRVPREYIPSVDAGIQDAMQYGVLAGYPLVGVKATLLDGGVPRRRLLGNGVQDRRLDGLQGGRPQGHPVLLEPMMAVEVTHARGLHGRRHRRPQLPPWPDPGHGGRSGAPRSSALVPLSEMFGYVGDLRSKTQGRANYSMQFDSYAEVPEASPRRSSRRPGASETVDSDRALPPNPTAASRHVLNRAR